MQRISLTLLAILLSLSAMAQSSVSNYETAKHLDIFNRLYKELDLNYVDSLVAKDVIEDAIYYMLEQLDPYTTYYPEEEQDDLRQLTTGKYAGVGSLISYHKDHDRCIISEPYANMPAAQAGLRCGDVILAIDGIEMPKCGKRNVRAYSDSVSSAMRGEPGTQLRIRVERYGEPKPLDFTITRRSIQLPTVDFCRMINDSIGIIGLNAFHENTAQEVRQAILDLKSQGMRRLLLDLRGNGGGLLESAVQIVGMFVPKGTQVLQTRGRNKQQEKTYKTTQEPIDIEIPLVVMIDGGSASSAEIVAGSLQDLDRAVIVGARSFGKGLVQTTRTLPYEGLLKVTISKYYIPSGRLIQAIDYSHRNPDGTVARIPDSLTTVFHTANGREVRDGGGITPDVKIEYPQINRLIYNIISDNWAFDFGTKYAAEHQSIGRAEDFEITDSIYEQFKASIDPTQFKYDKVCEEGLKSLRKVAEAEGYMNDSTKAQFDALEKLLKHNLNHDLDVHREEIAKILAGEILRRYYYQRGDAIAQLKGDETVDAVEKIVNTPGEWERILCRGKREEVRGKR